MQITECTVVPSSLSKTAVCHLETATAVARRPNRLLFFLAPVFLSTTLAVNAEGPVESLIEGESRSRSHTSNTLISYSFEAQRAGTYLVEVSQGGLDLQVLVSSAGAPTVTYNSPSFRDGRESIILEPVRAGQTYTIGIKSDEYTDAVATHEISISEIRDAVAARGYRLITEAASTNYLGGDENWHKSLSQYTDALDIWRKQQNMAEQARTLLCLANLQYWQFESWLEAAASAAGAAKLHADLGNAQLHASSMFLQAASLIEAALAFSSGTESAPTEAARHFDTALQLFDGALEIFVEIGDEYGEARTINNIGLTHYYMDNWSNAAKHFEKAASQFRRQKEWSDELNPLANLAVIDFELGHFGRAVETLTRLLELIPADREPEWRADTLDNLGAALLVLGRVDSALRSFFDALTLHEQIDNAKGQGRSLTGIGSTYFSIGEMALAREFFERALPIREQANDGRGQVAVLHFLGDVHRNLGNFERALHFHDRAADLAVTPMARVKIEILRARDYFSAGEYEQAAALLQQLDVAAQRASARAIAADASYELGRALARMGSAEDAQLKLEEAYDLYEDIGSLGGRAKTLLELGRIGQTNDLGIAIEYGERAITYIEQLRGQLANPESRAVYLSTRRHYYEFLIDALVSAYESTDSPTEKSNFLLQALSVSERARARAIVDLMREAAVDVRRGVDPGVKARQDALYGELVQKQFERDKLLEQDADQERVDAVVAELHAIRAGLDVLEIELRETNSRFSILRNPVILTTEQIREQLDDESVVLQYWLGDSASYLWAVSKSDVRVTRIADRQTIDALARQVYESLSGVGVNNVSVRNRNAALHSLSKLVLRPAATAISGKARIIVAADGSLQYVPFALLSLDDQDALVQTHEVVVVPSISALAVQRKTLANRPSARKTLAAIGDPVFERSDSRFNESVGARRSFHTTTSSGFPRLFADQDNFARLPFSAMEIEQIAGLIPEGERFVATGFDATRSGIVGGDLADYRILHIGTHGVIDSRHPALSTLVFSLLDESGQPSNGFLRLHDIYNLELSADLVVLSACETGLGREIRGEGLIGLTQGFMYAGARSVVASLWRVSDRAAAELMTHFYRYLLVDEYPPAEALRRAQRDMASERRWSDPYFWSGFVLHGDWT